MQECSGNKILYVDLSTKEFSEADILTLENRVFQYRVD